MRDHRKLQAFVVADALVKSVYEHTKSFPADERYGLTSQLRRATVSIAANIVEGSARRSHREYLNFLNIALGSASEARYLWSLALHFNYVTDAAITTQFNECVASLSKLADAVSSFSGPQARGPKPEA
jgi:four helix bundle protein